MLSNQSSPTNGNLPSESLSAKVGEDDKKRSSTAVAPHVKHSLYNFTAVEAVSISG